MSISPQTQFSGSKRSRSPSSTSPGQSGKKPSGKKRRLDSEAAGAGDDSPEPREKVKLTRGSRACTVCRRLKMKCEGAENGPPCKRCAQGVHDCVFEESMRGKRNHKKQEALSGKLHSLEQQLNTLQASLPPSLSAGDAPASTSGFSPTPSSLVHSTPASSHLPGQSPAQLPSQPSSAPSSPLPNLPNNALNPLGLLAEASLQKHRSAQRSPSRHRGGPRAGSAGPEPREGDALRDYFKPGPMTLLPIRRLVIERQIQPEILEFVEMEEVMDLFNIFFDNLNHHCCLLDRQFHTAPLVCSRSPFLLTAVCAIASKFYKGRDDGGELHIRLNNVVKKLAWSTPAQGYKSVEIVQAYLLLALWGTGPVQRFEQDRTWLLLGMAIRMATDLNLHRASPTSIPLSGNYVGYDDEEVRNRERTWIMCYNLDRSLSAQMGKPYSIQEDYIIRNAALWAQHPGALPADKALCGFLDYQRILSRCVEFFYAGTSDPSGLLKNCDWSTIIKAYEAQLAAWRDGFHKARECVYRNMVSALHHHYSMLVINTFGLHYAREHSHVDIAHFFSRCYSSAVECARIITQEMGPSGYLKYSPDSHFVLCSYAVITLLKLVRPEFENFLPGGVDPIKNVRDAADVLAKVAVNKYHTPALYAAFLRALINVRDGTSGPATRHTSVAPTTPAPPPQNAGSTTEVSEQLSPFGEMNGDGQGVPPPAAPVQDSAHVPTDFGDYTFGAGFGGTGTEVDELGNLNGPFGGILTDAFWDSVLIPGYSNTLDLSGGFVFGSGGSGLITPRVGSPTFGNSALDFGIDNTLQHRS
ncbi:hypothetical protein CALVIDRAFT_475249 [Calocera viscosa TUFC12733]|uniref:Zn(2)-C6 fungal-type domain-containing protein n=1 Tax=Calocera viscosa (strain TUFC12733) TaxID=1330018 RepID=A0A167RMA8_CALVF|nr:hypothetical protein CALVIDRAFT_475249 [Calocera viscosa TUFC12733]